MPTKMTIRAHELATLLDRAPDGITTLSLDCFDTLLWRNTHAPKDVFCGIPLAGGAIHARSWAEGNAQRAAHRQSGSHEIRLADIYRRMMVTAGEDDIAAAVEHELTLEERHLFPFAPTVALMHAAKARGLNIVIVSDMYLGEADLRRLLARCAGEDVLALVDHIFMSCDHGKPKAHGLFEPMLKTLGVRPEQVLHVGDNKHADYRGAARAGLNAVHLVQFDPATVTRLRLEMVAHALIDPTVRVTTPSLQPHRAAASLRTSDDPAQILGHDVMGPVLHAFAEFVHGEVEAMRARLGKPVRPVFLMRDGHLPYEVYTAMYPDSRAVKAELSRLVATRASLADKDLLDRFLTGNLEGYSVESLARHLMLEPAEYAAAVRGADKVDPRVAIAASAMRGDLNRRILRRAAAFRTRMIAHLHAAGIADGDAILLVDLGYNGSVQNAVAPALERSMGATVAGRYLLLREAACSGLDKRGLLDAEMFDTRTLHALATCIAVVEQMCNVEQGSTIDFAADGTPVREPYVLNPAQHAVREPIQAAAIAYARTARDGMHRPPASDDLGARRAMAAAILTRLLFLPMKDEIALFQAFDHDNNLGSATVERLLDPAEARDGLRLRGLSYINAAERMYMPAEIAAHGLPLNMILLATSRFGLDLRSTDFQVGGIDVPVLLLDANDQTVVPMTAYPTHDGWYRLAVPAPRAGLTIAVKLGQIWSCVQMGEALWVPADQFDGDRSAYSDALCVMDATTEISTGIHACEETGLAIVPSNGRNDQILTLIFRPLTARDAAADAAQKVAA